MFIKHAHAKINLALDVLYKRDDGFHEVEMVMTTIDLADELIFDELPEDNIIVTTNKHYLPVDENNLVYRAANLIKDKYNIKKGIKIHIEKNIPVAAGLAGGSADAASTLKGLNELWNLNISMSELQILGAEIGSDVPFCIYGKTALATGRGEIITPLPTPPFCWIVLIKPRYGVSTKDVYENLNLSNIKHADIKSMIKSIENKDYSLMCDSLGNSLENSTFEIKPELKDLKDRVYKYGADGVLMSGSGTTIFALVDTESKRNRIINSLDRRNYGIYSVRLMG